MVCAFCGRLADPGRIYFRDECQGCGRDLHICRNCEFHDPGVHQECRETSAEYVADKERANLCEYFRPGIGGAGLSDTAAARSQLEALFSKK